MKTLQTKNKFYKVTLLIYSILSIASTIYLLVRPDESVLRYQETKQEIEQIKSYLQERDATYEQTIDSLKDKSDSLQSVIQDTDKYLEYSRLKSNYLSDELNAFINLFENDSSLVKDEIAFDSLSLMSTNFIHSAKVSDSLCAKEIFLLNELLLVKDVRIQTSDSLLGDYKSSVEQLLETSNELNEKLNKTEKKLTRKRRFNRTLSVGLVVVSGYLIYKIL